MTDEQPKNTMPSATESLWQTVKLARKFRTVCRYLSGLWTLPTVLSTSWRHLFNTASDWLLFQFSHRYD